MDCLPFLRWAGVLSLCFALTAATKGGYPEIRQRDTNRQNKYKLLQQVPPKDVRQLFGKFYPSSIENRTTSPSLYLNHSPSKYLTNSASKNLTHSLSKHLTHLLSKHLTHSPSKNLTHSPSKHLTHSLSKHLIHSPSKNLTHSPSKHLIHSPSKNLTHSPSKHLTHSPSKNLTHSPSKNHTHSPSKHLTHSPSKHLNHRNHRQLVNQFSTSHNDKFVRTMENVTEDENMRSRKKLHAKLNNNEVQMLIPDDKRHYRSAVEEKADFSRMKRQTSTRDIDNGINDVAILTKVYQEQSLRDERQHLAESSLTPGPSRQHKDFQKLRPCFFKCVYPVKNDFLSDKGQDNTKEKSAVSHNFSITTKRSATITVSEKRKIRKKRFLFFEPAENPPMPSLFSIMMGTAHDPNTGKRIEFGGDIMRDMIVNSFLPFLPPSARPPPGKEPGELVQMMAPVWYFNRLQRATMPRTKVPPRNFNQKRNQQGYYGETMQGK